MDDNRIAAGDDPGSLPLPRRAFLHRSAALVGGIAGGAATGTALAQTPAAAPWQQTPGAPPLPYGTRSRFEQAVRYPVKPFGDIAPGAGPTFSPIETLEGTITPNDLHFIRIHNGVPDIDPKQHRLLIHGMVDRPLVFTVDALLRYPMSSRIYFLECAGNSSRNLAPQPLQIPAGALHGLISCSEWTGVPLRMLLEEAGVKSGAGWVLAEGADAASMSRSVPLEKAFDDALIALYQNGERLRPEQGYPVRLLLPGWLGNTSVKWLRRLKVTDAPTQTKDETSKYTDPLPDGKARQFKFEMGVKSVITRPSSTMKLGGQGFHEISGMAWSGAGRISRVEVSTDGGKSWRDALLTGQDRARGLVRFRAGWDWRGEDAVLQSRATDEKGHVQPRRSEWTTLFAPDIRFHNNSIVSWAVGADGSVKNVYA
ncbi:MAG TPA: sulfite dehydrogenase [Ramlibacter sp.]|nr:sulfite dehydrogenase [Ramlibacter sp.]